MIEKWLRLNISFNANFECLFILQTTGEGNSKKVAKKHAAENMLNELKKLPPLRVASETQANGRRKNFGGRRNASANSRQQVQQINPRRKGSVTSKEINISASSTDTTTASEESDASNPISVLLRMQQATKQIEPIYTMTEERGHGRRKEFTMEVKYSGLTGHGIGNSKKIAKREAAKNVLLQLGYDENGNAIANVNVNVNANVSAGQAVSAIDKSRKVTFTETKVYTENSGQVGGAAGRQLVPGLLLMKGPENIRSK